MKINKTRIFGAVIFMIGLAAHFLLDTMINGFWIGAAIGLGIALMVIGRIQKV